MAAALYDQSRPAGRRHREADGRWVKIPGNFKWWRDEEDRIAGYPAGHLAAIHGWTHGLRITYEAEWVALRKASSDAVANFAKKRGHLFATAPEHLSGAECTVFWDYQNVPLKVGITDLTGKRVTFTCDNYLQVINLAFAHYLARTREFKRRFGGSTPPESSTWPTDPARGG